MTKPTRRELLKVIKQRYLKASKAEKTATLNEFCQSTGYSRLYAIRILQARHQYTSTTRARACTYGSQVLLLIINIWELLDYPCGTRLKPQLVPMLESLVRSKEISPVSDGQLRQLRSISAKTLDRRLKKERIIRRLKKNRGATRHGSLLKSHIPIRITDWDTRRIGFMEMDTVAHNGGNPSGLFVYSLDMVEIATGWSEQVAVLGKGEKEIVNAITEIRKGLPFRLRGMDSDGGGEFVNWHMVKYCAKEQLYFTRSRPDRKNDNAYVEQKNYTHIRKWLGYRRYDTVKQRDAMNDLYRNELRRFNNYFRPVMKITSKQRINNSVAKKKYGQALTPYQRLMQSKQIPPKTKALLQKAYESLNPVQLKKAIETKLKRILGS